MLLAYTSPSSRIVSPHGKNCKLTRGSAAPSPILQTRPFYASARDSCERVLNLVDPLRRQRQFSVFQDSRQHVKVVV